MVIADGYKKVRSYMNPYQRLANAIVVQAVKDWRYAVRKLKTNPTAWSAKHLKKHTEEFFLSGWFSDLTSVNGAYLLAELRKEGA